MFDGGRRFNGEEVIAIFKAQHLAGRSHEWNVTEPDIHISGNTAWIAYVNDGSISDASGGVHQRWLESGFLAKQAGTWKVLFMQVLVSQQHKRTESESSFGTGSATDRCEVRCPSHRWADSQLGRQALGAQCLASRSRPM
jgi:hypothetical protein